MKLIIAAIFLMLAGCAGQPDRAARSPVLEFVMAEAPGMTWTKWSDGTYTSSAGHDGNVDPRLPLCDAVTISRRAGKSHATECRVR